MVLHRSRRYSQSLDLNVAVVATDAQMKAPTARQGPGAASAPRLTQPREMKTKKYIYGVESLNGYDAWALFEACARGDVSKVNLLLAKDRRLVNAQYWYRFPVHLAVFGGHAEIVKFLLDHDADPGQSIYTYDSWDKLLQCAAERGHRRIVSLLQRAMHKRFNYTPDFDGLKEAIIARDSRKVGVVLRRQPDLVRASDALGNNPLHWSVITRQLGLIELFVKLGTPIDAQRADGLTPLLQAVNGATDYWYRATRARSHPSLRNTSVIVGNLLARGANYTISVAAAVGDLERVDELLRKDAGLARRLDSARGSPLSYAAREGHLHIVRLLLEHGAEPNTPEDAAPDGRALYAACRGNHLQVAELLLEHGANPNAGVDSCGCCLTIGRVYHGDQAKPLQQLLRRHGAVMPHYAMNAKELREALGDDHDLDPANVVACPRTPALVRKLLERGLDPNGTDWLGKTFLHECAERGDRSVAAILLDAGGDIDAHEVEFQGTPLAAAVRTCCAAEDSQQAERARRMVEFLIKRGARVNLPGDEPWATPLAWATRHGRSDLVELLKSAT